MIYNKTELRKEALCFLGSRHGTADENVLQLLECYEKLVEEFTPKYVYKMYNVSHELLIGNDIHGHLKNCNNVIFLAATLGSEADRAIRRLEVTKLSAALVLDAVANAAIEQVLDQAEIEIKQKLKSRLTTRFSPGYGDFPLDIQEKFLDALDARRKIGLTVNSNLLLTPCKSVTAVIGIIAD
jgi:hypothetical protein